MYKSYSTKEGYVTKVYENGVAFIEWFVNRSIVIEVHFTKPEHYELLADSIHKRVRISGLTHYEDNGRPVRIDPVFKIERVERIRPDLDKLVGIIKLDVDSVEAVRRVREEWD